MFKRVKNGILVQKLLKRSGVLKSGTRTEGIGNLTIFLKSDNFKCRLFESLNCFVSVAAVWLFQHGRLLKQNVLNLRNKI